MDTLVLFAYFAACFLSGALANYLSHRFTLAIGVSFGITCWTLLTITVRHLAPV